LEKALDGTLSSCKDFLNKHLCAYEAVWFNITAKRYKWLSPITVAQRYERVAKGAGQVKESKTNPAPGKSSIHTITPDR
jgi:uncharacterized Fe-S cluster-containing radical SAM superfamily protein